MKEIIQEKVATPNSSLIEYLVYNFQTEVLVVKYKRGAREGEERRYNGISKADYLTIVTAKSQGKELLKVLSKYKGERKSFFSAFIDFFNSSNKKPY